MKSASLQDSYSQPDECESEASTEGFFSTLSLNANPLFNSSIITSDLCTGLIPKVEPVFPPSLFADFSTPEFRSLCF
jgi:hypothetical protein